MKYLKVLVAALCFILLMSCTAHQIRLQSELIPSSDETVYFLDSVVSIKASNSLTSTLESGTRWRHIGDIEEGGVYKTKDQIVVVNSFNVHEGYIVVQSGQVMGYFLPVEKTFVMVKPTEIKFIEMEFSDENS